jgi:hypothetical protein
MSRRFDPSVVYFLIGAIAASYSVWILIGNQPVGHGPAAERAAPIAATIADQ